jgi:hypothetical protein
MAVQSSKTIRATEATKEIDDLIRRHFLSSSDEPAAAVSVADRWSWAKSLHMDLEIVDARLERLCERLPLEAHDVVPRYRLKYPLPPRSRR